MARQPFDLEQLGDRYEIIGETAAGAAGSISYMAKRRADGMDATITVTEVPEGDEGNALSHLAADTNLLTSSRHRSLLPVLEGRWLGPDVFAVVTEGVYAPTLEELLARRDEAFDFPRIAAILRDANALLEWAREQKVVHRALTTNSLYLERGSDALKATFVARALPLADMPGADDDARTVAELAHAMLTRSAVDPERAQRPLAELRPGLPNRVIEDTNRLLGQRPETTELPDVRNYIASIAMAEMLKRVEAEHAAAEQRIQNAERLAHEEIEARRREFEQALADQQSELRKERERFAREMADAQRVPIRRRRPSPKLLALAAGVLLFVVAASLLTMSRLRRPDVAVETSPVDQRIVVESDAGLAAQADSESQGTATLPPDFVNGVATRAALAPPPKTPGIQSRRRRIATFRQDTLASAINASEQMVGDTMRRLDSARQPATRIDTLPRLAIPTVRIDSLVRPPRPPRPDTVRRDSVRRDTVLRRDTLAFESS